MKKFRCIHMSIVLALLAVLAALIPTVGQSQGKGQVSKETRPTTVEKKKAFTPGMASVIRQYRRMVASAGLLRHSGVKVVKAPAIRRSTARPGVPRGAKVSPPPTPGAGGSAGDVTYTITVRASDVTSSDGSQHISQTIIVKGTDGHTYTDIITYDNDGEGNSTETQTVSDTDEDGNTTSETVNTTGGNADDMECVGIVCADDINDACCMVCPKMPHCGQE